MNTTIKFNKHFVTNGQSKARVHYSPSVDRHGKKMITLYEKDYGRDLGKIFTNVENDTDTMTDYFDDNKVRIYEGEPQYEDLKNRLVEWGKIQKDF